jgi:regulator of RNase E activity RraA
MAKSSKESPSNPFTTTPGIVRPDKALMDALRDIGAATAAGELTRLGIRSVHMQGPVAWAKGRTVVGPALTLQFMPKREDQYNASEYADPEKQLHRHVLYHTQPGDIVVVDARGDMQSGIFGEMMLTFFKGQGGAGVVIDGCIRDYPHVKELDLPMWLRGVTPNFHTQTGIIPWAVNVPISCGGVLVIPGDIIVADDDGVVVVPAALAPELVKKASEHAEWEVFSRMKLEEGGHLTKYYPLSAEAQKEYEAWKSGASVKADKKDKKKKKKK